MSYDIPCFTENAFEWVSAAQLLCTIALFYHNDDSVLFSRPSCPILSQSFSRMPSPLLPSCPASPSTVPSFITLTCRLLFLECSVILWPFFSSFQSVPVPAVFHFLTLQTQLHITVGVIFFYYNKINGCWLIICPYQLAQWLTKVMGTDQVYIWAFLPLVSFVSSPLPAITAHVPRLKIESAASHSQ